MKHYIIYLLVCLVAMGGCSSEPKDANGELSNEASYVALVNIEGQNYAAHEFNERENFTIDEKLGEINRKLEDGTIPREHLTSNYFQEGTQVFSVKENPQVFLVKDFLDGEDVYHIMKKSH